MKVFQYQFFTWLSKESPPDIVRTFEGVMHFIWIFTGDNPGPYDSGVDSHNLHVVIQPGEIVYYWDHEPGMFALRNSRIVSDF